jgi:hypothetical protein
MIYCGYLNMEDFHPQQIICFLGKTESKFV